MSNNTNSKMVVPGAKQAIDKMKYEIANEFGVNLGPDTTSTRTSTYGAFETTFKPPYVTCRHGYYSSSCRRRNSR